jgi:hypothetical protein
MDDVRDTGPTIPRSTDEENAPVDTTSAEPLRKAKIEEPPTEDVGEVPPRINRDDDPLYGGNPPRTTKGNFTSPKFGSAGSGGAEFEPGPERD